MNNRELTIAEYARLNDVSVQSVYDRINRGTLNTIEKAGKKGRKIKYIIVDTTEEEDNKLEETENNNKNDKKIKELEEKIEDLQNKLLEKDKIILDYSNKIIEYTNKFAEMAENSQRIAEKALNTTGQAQLLHAVDKQKEIEPIAELEEPKKKRGWFARLWFGED